MCVQAATEAQDPVATFLAQEQRRGADFVATIDISLEKLAQALRGNAPLPAATAAFVASLLRSQTPEEWLTAWDHGPAVPLDFLQAAAARVAGGAALAARHAKVSLIDSGEEQEPVPLCHLFEPQGLLATLRQVCAARLSCSVDALALRNAWAGSMDVRVAQGSKQADGIAECAAPLVATGIALEGALLDTSHSLGRVAASSPPTAPLPPILLAWAPADGLGGNDQGNIAQTSGKAGTMVVPLYARRDRSQLLLDLQIAVCSESLGQELTLAGAACFIED